MSYDINAMVSLGLVDSLTILFVFGPLISLNHRTQSPELMY